MKFIGFKWLYRKDLRYALIILLILSVLFWLSLMYSDFVGLKYFWSLSTFIIFCFFSAFVTSFIVGTSFNRLFLFTLLVVSFFSFSYDYDGFKNSLLVGYAIGLAYQSPLLVNIVVDLFGRTKNNRVLMKGYRKILGSYFFLVLFFGVLILNL